jgi:tRNA(Ile)-lysidine synthase
VEPDVTASRRPSVITLARRSLTSEAGLARGTRLLVAVSGGADSMGLLHVLARVGPTLGLSLVAHGVDHGLRAEAARELDVAGTFAGTLGIPWGRTLVPVTRGGNLQARARDARYGALAAAASHAGATAIATAHHADDRAETVLIRLMRGAGPRGVAVLPPRAPLPAELGAGSLELVRPLLRVRRHDLRAHVARHGVPFSDDPSNADPRYLRTRVRKELLPLMESLAPGVVDHLTALADQLGELVAGASSRPGEGELEGSLPFPLPRATRAAITELLRSRSTSARVWLPNGLVVTLDPRARPGPRARRER